METTHIFVFPDIHGRDFWKEPALKYKDDLSKKFIFLGDYFDPYPVDKVTENMAMDNWEELNSELGNRENTIWLLGNHDCHYLPELLKYYGCRRSVFFQKDITDIILKNFDKFQIAYEYVLESGLRIIFSHAGITPLYAKYLQYFINEKYGIGIPFDEIDILKSYNPDLYNNDIKYNIELLFLLWQISNHRGGEDPAGSCIWADLYEHTAAEHDYETLPEYKNIYQVFSHSYCTKPYITKKFAMLDCREVFVIDCKDGKLMTYKEFDESIGR